MESKLYMVGACLAAVGAKSLISAKGLFGPGDRDKVLFVDPDELPDVEAPCGDD